MGQIVKLIKLVERLAELDDEDTIYGSEPWTEDSDAMVAPEPGPAPYQIPLEAAEASAPAEKHSNSPRPWRSRMCRSN